MLLRIKLIFLLLFVLKITLHTQPYELKSMNGPNGGIIGDIAINSNGVIYAGVYSLWNFYYGLYKSEDNGDSWVQIEMPDEQIEIYAIYISKNNNIYVGTNFGGRIWRSTDDGETWENIRDGYNTGECWAFGESLDGVLFAGDGQYLGTYRSLNGGDSWEHVADIGPIVFATDTSNNIYAGSLSFGLFTSHDLGQTWHQNEFLRNLPVSAILIDSLNHIYCGTGYEFHGRGVFYSEDKGETWEHLGLDGEEILSLALDSKHNLYAGSLMSGLFKTTDNGRSWTRHTNGLFHKQVFRMKINKEDDIFIGSEEEGIFRSTDYGEHFEQIGLPISKTESFIIAPNGKIYAATPSGVQEYNPLSEKWKNIGLHKAEAIDINAETGELYVSTFADGVFRSTDYGNTWIETSMNTATRLSVYNIKVLKDGSLLIATERELRRSTDNGETWVKLPIRTNFFMHSIFVHENGKVYVNGRQNHKLGIFCSTNNGLSFNKITDLPEIFNWILDNSLSANSNGDIFICSNVENGGVFRIADGDTTLEKIHDKAITVYVGDNNRLYVGGYEYVDYSKDNGNSWLNLCEFTNNVVTDFKFDKQGYFYMGTAGVTLGMLRSQVPVSVNNENENISEKFILEQNYPNPFNPTTKITYVIPNVGGANFASQVNVKLTIYDALGREVATLVNARQTPGKYSVQFNASNLPSGIYFYTLRAGDFAQTRKMVLMK